MNRQNILGVSVDSTHMRGVLREVSDYIARREKFYIVTPNPEIILQAQNDSELKKILNEANISLNDGIGNLWAREFLSPAQYAKGIFKLFVLVINAIKIVLRLFINRSVLEKDFRIIKGREMFIQLIKYANKNEWKVFLLGGENGTSNKASKSLRKNYKRVKIECDAGPVLDEAGVPVSKDELLKEKSAISTINKCKPHILFVGFGAPKQEKWLYRNLKDLNIGGAMVVGGTFDYISGKTKIPPKWVSDVGAEWLWRLLTGSQKASRIFDATVQFPLAVFKSKL